MRFFTVTTLCIAWTGWIAWAGLWSGDTVAKPYPVAVVQGLDKIRARISIIEVPLNQKMTFGSLTFFVLHCDKRPPEDPPESTAWIEVEDNKEVRQGRQKMTLSRPVFRGWMFASSPAVSALEHPIYDLTLIDCVEAK